MLPPFLSDLGVRVTYSLDEAVAGADVIMMLRLQLERMGQGFISPCGNTAAISAWGLRHLEKAKEDVIIMNPGPLKSGGGDFA